MSNALAIAAVTTTLRNLIKKAVDAELGMGNVTTQPPDKAREAGNNSGNQINLFLYQTQPNASWRNRDLPTRVRAGETAYPPLALNLYYLVTAYGQNNDDIVSHRLLGLAMQALHDNTVLKPADIRMALADSYLHRQVERVHLSPSSINLDEMSKLWSMFQTQYRISAAYEASVILIESGHGVKAPLPVLTVGKPTPDGEDGGLAVQASLEPPIPTFPILERLEFPTKLQPSLRLEETLRLLGHNLQWASARQIRVDFRHPLLSEPIQQAIATETTNQQLSVRLDSSETAWLAGTYTVSVTFEKNTQSRTTNALSFSLAPRLILPSPDVEITSRERRFLTIVCQPRVWLWRHAEHPEQVRGQQVVLFVGDREFSPLIERLPEVDADLLDNTPREEQKTDQLVFDLSDLPRNRYLLRLRVDGVDSFVINWQAETPQFDPSQQINLN